MSQNSAFGTAASVFSEQANRLLRTKWNDPNELAQELFAILQAQIPINTQAPITAPGMNLSSPAGVTINVSDQSGPVGKLTITRDGGMQFTPTTPATPATPTKTAPPAQQVFPGKVASSGNGNVVTVTIYPQGLGKPGKLVRATQLQMSQQGTIPQGTWALVVQTGENYYIQIPVWL